MTVVEPLGAIERVGLLFILQYLIGYGELSKE
jgi:hypothetical protein